MIIHYWPLIIIFTVLLIVRELFAYRKNLSVKYFITPLVTVSVVITALLSIQFAENKTVIFMIITGLVFSLIGDTMLMIEEIQFFRHGLIFFLLAQVTYSAALAADYSFRMWNILVAAGLLALIIAVNKAIKHKSGNYEPLVLIYSIVISIMFYLAMSYFSINDSARGLLLSAGAFLFVISDLTIAFSRFIKEIPNSTVYVWMTYGPAQFLIALSCYYN